jgi:hypothetical protein
MKKFDTEIEDWDDEEWEEWDGKIGETSNTPKNEGFFPDLKRRKLPPDTAIRWAFQKRQSFFEDVGSLKLLLAPIGKKNQRKIVEFLFDRYSATIAELRMLTEVEPLTPDALRKTIERLNKLFRKEGLNLRLDWEESHGDGLDEERVWLDVRN